MLNYKTKILTKSQIQEYLGHVDLFPLIEKGFIAYSAGHSVVPPVGELILEEPPGEVHIKYGYIKKQKYYVVKIASGFPNNVDLGLSTSQGVMLLFSQQTGFLECILLDEGILTDIRTVIASMITIKYLAPADISCVGIIGTGIQAKLQLEYLHKVIPCKNIVVWGRNEKHVIEFKNQFLNSDYNIKIAGSTKELAEMSQVIITTTSASSPLLSFEDLRPGTHVTALGSDTGSKIELDPDILENADIIVSDSIPQSQSRGEVFQARQNGKLDERRLIELGTLIKNPAIGRKNNHQITIADLTGVAVQDIMIATAIYEHHRSLSK